MYDLTAFQRDLLYTIPKIESASGLDIKAELEEYYGTEIHPSRLYHNLDSLATKGLVEKGENGHRANAYSLTRRGRRDLSARAAWENEKLRTVAGRTAGADRI